MFTSFVGSFQERMSSTTTYNAPFSMPDFRCGVALLCAGEPCIACEPTFAITNAGKTTVLFLCCSTYTARDSVFEASYDGPDNT